MFFAHWLRGCSVCRQTLPFTNWLCSACSKKLQNFYLSPQDIVRAEKDLTHFRLLDWNEENDFFVRLFVSSLKSGGPKFIFKRIMQDFLFRIRQNYVLPEDMTIIPCPPSSGRGSKDHAFRLAHSLSSLTGFKLLQPFTVPLPRNQNQKRKTRQERSRVHFSLKENIDTEKVIFMDDILTTGATARAAFQALNKPKNFLIFTIAYRSPLLNE